MTEIGNIKSIYMMSSEVGNPTVTDIGYHL